MLSGWCVDFKGAENGYATRGNFVVGRGLAPAVPYGAYWIGGGSKPPPYGWFTVDRFCTGYTFPM